MHIFNMILFLSKKFCFSCLKDKFNFSLFKKFLHIQWYNTWAIVIEINWNFMNRKIISVESPFSIYLKKPIIATVRTPLLIHLWIVIIFYEALKKMYAKFIMSLFVFSVVIVCTRNVCISIKVISFIYLSLHINLC